MKKHIPNFLTCCSLMAGCLALVSIHQENLLLVPIWVIIAAFFDFIDGMAARLLQVSSPMGKELDSLSDMVSFGVVPGFLVFSLLGNITTNQWIPFLGFLITIFSALRLAKFNIDERQSDQFIGLPTPANAIFFSGLLLLPDEWNVINNDIALIVLTILFSYLLVAELPLLALKFKRFSWKNNELRYMVILFSVLLVAIFQLAAAPMIIIMYIGVSVLSNIRKT